MALRGEKLREHILWKAKEVFLEMGFERAAIDVVAARAGTSKRSLYAHFESKEKLFLAVIDLVRGLFLKKLKIPGDYSENPLDALTIFCGRYLEILLYEPSIQMCRVSMAETTRFPKGAVEHFDVIFTEVHTRLSVYLSITFELSADASSEAAKKLLGQILYPLFVRALFGMEALSKSIDEAALSENFDLKEIRKTVADLIVSVSKN
ncbi:hypothetical protein VZ95_20685 [Elstera litoralis]|uniref:HTH tetR-type domain-containing protein n=1 Tax=Elstera litoralis TaxID=552518 RepID=A0A0F3ILU6_9PROT|nr:TetR/AcrR family transcriptional regulator [Elstera litoralis]KJV06534.1 hypothetical protein VZ95_20685 [Elstera litoralis]